MLGIALANAADVIRDWSQHEARSADEPRNVSSPALPFAADTLPPHAQEPVRFRGPNIVAIGGGTGLPMVLRGLSDVLPPSRRQRRSAGAGQLTAIVTVTDDGGSSGRLRRELGVVPPGDVRNCLAALSQPGSVLTELLQHRFSGTNGLSGHAVGNLMLAALTEMTGDFAVAIDRLSAVLGVQGRILPATRDHVELRAELEGGTIVIGESAIARQGRRVRRLSLDRPARAPDDAVRAIIAADVIVLGPGSLYTSILPNLLVSGLAAAIAAARATRVYIANLMTEPGETDGFDLDDHLRAIREHAGGDLFDYVLVNARPIQPTLMAAYAARGSMPVTYTAETFRSGRPELVERSLAGTWEGGKIRHVPAEVAEAILELTGRPRLTS